MAVRTADRTLEIFSCFARLQTPLTVSEIGRELSLPTSTCYALVKTLVDTGFLFPETLAYRDDLVGLLGLTDVRAVQPSDDDLATLDPDGFLWSTDPDRCCDIRKVKPLAEAISGYDAWITGRKRFQSDTRATLPLFEAEGERVKINPLAGWNASELLGYLDRNDLPRHRLVAKGYPSIGCIPCTSPVKPGEDARAGRWRGKGKTECGIHIGILSAGQDI